MWNSGMVRKLNETTNFIALYEYHVGKTEVPVLFHRWSAISLLAACMGNNVWLEKFPGVKLYPNLYVLLIGESASGKGIAIDVATDFAEQEPEIINPFRVSGTKRGNIELLAQPKRFPDPWYHGTRMYMIAPELVNNVGSGPLADDWVRWMTDMFTIKGTYTDTTGMYGVKQLKDPLINWLAGSTEGWMRKSISEDAITGGFFARTVVVPGEIDYAYRIHKPSIPADFAEIKEHLRHRVYYACRAYGRMVLSPEAEVIDASWYNNRPAPSEESLSAIWKRQHDIVLKVAMVLALSDLLLWDGNYDFTVKAKHIQLAQTLVDGVRANIGDIVKLTTDTRESGYYAAVVKPIQDARNGIAHTALLKKVYPKGIGARLLANLIATLMEAGHVQVETRGDRGARYYVWCKRRLG
jgi:hypothetical protein